ncbi:hypothetical protein [uncultured Microscilla sp.]|uniref:hypothetical protein n=1 Tax=uncultured Microscilla sp. TaxID=432653 RepID=UPI002606F14E|nr:hypothetical protein [uncultured Microscilla sp.]
MKKNKLHIKSNWDKNLTFNASQMQKIKGGDGTCGPTNTKTELDTGSPPPVV